MVDNQINYIFFIAQSVFIAWSNNKIVQCFSVIHFISRDSNETELKNEMGWNNVVQSMKWPSKKQQKLLYIIEQCYICSNCCRLQKWCRRETHWTTLKCECICITITFWTHSMRSLPLSTLYNLPISISIVTINFYVEINTCTSHHRQPTNIYVGIEFEMDYVWVIRMMAHTGLHVWFASLKMKTKCTNERFDELVKYFGTDNFSILYPEQIYSFCSATSSPKFISMFLFFILLPLKMPIHIKLDTLAICNVT